MKAFVNIHNFVDWYTKLVVPFERIQQMLAFLRWKQILVGTILVLLFQCQDVFAETKGKLIGELRVVGGMDASEYPTLAFTAGTKLCSGTLIYPEYVHQSTKGEFSIESFVTQSTNIYVLFAIIINGSLVVQHNIDSCALCNYIYGWRLSWWKHYRWQRISFYGR
jgi:hypothetical protein